MPFIHALRPRRLSKWVAAAAILASTSIAFSVSIAGAATSTPAMVKDIGTGNADLVLSAGSLTDIFTDGGVSYFSAETTHGGTSDGDGLWRSDGTSSGTVQVASQTDLGGAGIDNFVKVGSDIYFTVVGTVSGATLVKKFNGSTVATVVTGNEVKTAVSGSGTAADYRIDTQFLWSAGGNLYFVAEVGPLSGTWDIFRFNGTTTARVTQVSSSSASDVGPVFELNNSIFYFSYVANLAGAEYGFDTIPATTRRSTTQADTSYFYGIQLGRVVILPGSPERAYMLMNTAPSSNYSVVSFDGTTVSAVLDGTTRISYASFPTVVGTRVFFPGADANSDDSLWYTTGTTGTKIVPNIQGHSWNIPSFSSGVFGSLNDATYVFLHRGATNYELWRSDGTASGTYRLADLEIGSYSSVSAVEWLYPAQGELFFPSASGSSATIRVRKTDGTVAGTGVALDLTPAVTGPMRFAQASGITYFYAQTSGAGRELHAATPSGGQSSSTTTTTPTTTTSIGGGNSTTTTIASSNNSVNSSGVPSSSEIETFLAKSLVVGGVVLPGQSYVVEANGFQPTESVNAFLKGSSSSLGVSAASVSGSAKVTVKIPKTTSGRQTLILFGSTSRHGVKQPITVGTSVTSLPETGSKTVTLQMVGLLMLAVGGLGYLSTRRKRSVS